MADKALSRRQQEASDTLEALRLIGIIHDWRAASDPERVIVWEHLDRGSHPYSLDEVIAFSRGVNAARDWAAQRRAARPLFPRTYAWTVDE